MTNEKVRKRIKDREQKMGSLQENHEMKQLDADISPTLTLNQAIFDLDKNSRPPPPPTPPADPTPPL